VPAAAAPASSSAAVQPSGDAPVAVKAKGVLKKKASLGGGADGEAAPFNKLASTVAAGADSGKVARELFALLIAPITIEEFYRCLPTPCNLHATPCEPKILHPGSSNLNPKPLTLYPKPETLHPQP